MKKSLHSKKIDFLDYLFNFKAYSEYTLKTYDEAITEAINKSEIYRDDEDVMIFNLMPLRLEIAHLKASTISKKLSAVRSFVDYEIRQGAKIKLKADESIKISRTLPKPLSHEHILSALEVAGIKEKLMVLILYTMGLRIHELSNIKLIDIHDGWIRVLGKGKKDRDIPILKNMEGLITQYIQGFSPRIYLFEKNAEKLSENSLRYSIVKLFKSVGIKMTPHQLRHSYATELLNNSAYISDVSELLGHSSMATTQIYTKLSSNIKMQNYLKAHPLIKEGH